MKILYLVVAALPGIVACVASGPEPAKAAANAGITVTESKTTVPGGQVEIIDVPSGLISADIPPPYQLDCRKERVHGTYISKTVCRRR